MKNTRNTFRIISIVAALTFLGMTATNILANSLPINNITTGEISNAYPNFFAPASITFAIWGVIYLLLGAYTVYQSGIFANKISDSTRSLIEKINRFYIVSSLANILWIFSWHYNKIGVSVVLMLVILYCLIKIADINRIQELTKLENLLIKVPFSVYFGWTTVATIANITTFLVSRGWGALGMPEEFWAVTVMLAGAVIGLARFFRDKSTTYVLVLIWAYFGIWLKHVTVFENAYPSVIYTSLICLGLFLLAVGRITAGRYHPHVYFGKKPC